MQHIAMYCVMRYITASRQRCLVSPLELEQKMFDTIVVFTRKNTEQIVVAGGSAAWKIKPENARKARYIVCARNGKESTGNEAHRAGFLIGRVKGTAPVVSYPGRYLIQISEWATLDIPDLWTFGRNPVHYLNLVDLGIDLTKLHFRPVAAQQTHLVPIQSAEVGDENILPLTIAQAKSGLAAAFGVDVSCVEITIRG